MKLEIENHLPDGVELTTGNPESINFDGDKSHVIMRFAVKPIEPEPDQHAELKAQYAQDVETCKSIDDLEACQLWQNLCVDKWYDYEPGDEPRFYTNMIYRRHPHADKIIEYHKCSDADKNRWQVLNALDNWANLNSKPEWDENYQYRLKPRTITIVVNGESKEYNAPLNVAPVFGAEYWVIEFSFAFGFYPNSKEWLESELDISALQESHVFSTQEDADRVADAFNQILAGAN